MYSRLTRSLSPNRESFRGQIALITERAGNLKCACSSPYYSRHSGRLHRPVPTRSRPSRVATGWATTGPQPPRFCFRRKASQWISQATSISPTPATIACARFRQLERSPPTRAPASRDFQATAARLRLRNSMHRTAWRSTAWEISTSPTWVMRACDASRWTEPSRPSLAAACFPQAARTKAVRPRLSRCRLRATWRGTAMGPSIFPISRDSACSGWRPMAR